ncbi:MAG TPA: sigma-70 family RNA polymerase sigma factor [Thermomicrobiales bacterium]|nr:sigma-70 family RNA polymerase sigma factor [Thermomicrobiales bacterium]
MTVAPTDLLGLDDAELSRMVADGSAEALEVLYLRYGRVVLAFSTRMMGDRQSGEELVQEVFVRAWRRARSFSSDRGSYVTWLLSITHNLCIDEIRKRNRRPQRAGSTDPVQVLVNVRDSGPSVELTTELSELRTVMANAMKTLPDHQRQAVELAFYQGLTQREVAEALDEPLGTIKTRIRLGMKKLRDYLEEHEVSAP